MTDTTSTLYHEITGEGETLILGHAGFVDSRMWDAQWNTFTEKYRVLRFDMQGFGQSGVATQPISRSEELLTLMDSLNIEKAHLLGMFTQWCCLYQFCYPAPATCSLANTGQCCAGWLQNGR